MVCKGVYNVKVFGFISDVTWAVIDKSTVFVKVKQIERI
jgi:hypothetical protein